MSGYRRFIAYVYEYPQGKKGNGKGFIKVEARNGTCRMQYKLTGIYGREAIPAKIYGYVRKHGGCEGILLGECDLSGDLLQFEQEMPEGNLGGSGYGLGDLCGLVLLGISGEMYGSGWDDRPVELSEIQFPDAGAERSEQPDPENRNRAQRLQEDSNRIAKESEWEEPKQESEGVSWSDTDEIEDSQEEIQPDPEEILSNMAEETQPVHALHENLEKPLSNRREIGFADAAEEVECSREEAASEEEHHVWKQQDYGDKNTWKEEANNQENDEREEAANRQASGWNRLEDWQEDETGSAPEENLWEELEDDLENAEEMRAEGTLWGEPETEMERELEAGSSLEVKTNISQVRPREGLHGGMEEDSEESQMEMESKIRQSQIPPKEQLLTGKQKKMESVQVKKAEEGVQKELAGQSALLKQSAFLPFRDQSIYDCRKITPVDFRYLNKRDRGLLHNRFLRHGFSCYGHLLLGKRQEDGRYILGVPGVYERQESAMANMFGFPYFKETGQKVRCGRAFGYWYRLLDQPEDCF